MSHLIIEQGKEVGKEVEVPPAGIKFGRSPANDLVLDDEAVMLFHGRFFFKSDGSLWVTDFGAGEKTRVGGEPIDEHQLKAGDLVEVGTTAFRIINTLKKSAPAPEKALVGDSSDDGSNNKEPAEVTAPEKDETDSEIDLGFKRQKKTRRSVEKKVEHKPGSLTSRLLQVSVILLVLIVLMVVGPSLLELSKTNVSTIQQEDSLSFTYERVLGTRQNIFRYQLGLDDAGVLSVKIDDLRSNRHQEESKQLSQGVLDQLSIQIESAGFFELSEDSAGVSEDTYNLYDLAIQRNHRFQQIRVLNDTPPPEIKRTAQIIEDYAVSELSISFTWLKEPEELLQLAESSFALAETRFAERDVRYANLPEAISHYKETILFLETIEPKPPLHFQATRNLDIANEVLDERYNDFLFKADQAIRLKDWQTAAKYLRILAELVPDRSDPRSDKISTKLLNVEQYLR